MGPKGETAGSKTKPKGGQKSGLEKRPKKGVQKKAKRGQKSGPKDKAINKEAKDRAHPKTRLIGQKRVQ